MIGFDISREEVQAGASDEILRLSSGEGYDALAEQTAALVSAGSSEALYIPAVKMIVDASLGILSLPSVADRLPSEVYQRRNIALYLTDVTVTLALMVDAFANFYTKNRYFKNMTVTEGDLEALITKEYLLSLGQSPFFDVGVVGGGALKLLTESEVKEPSTDVISRSTGLLAISGVYKGSSAVAVDYLGRPYAKTEHLEIVDATDGVEVGFTEETKEFLRQLHIKGRGCPAGKVEEPGSSVVLLEEYWQKIVHYLVPKDATAQANGT